MRRHAGKRLGDFNVPIAGRVREVGQVGLIGHNHVRVVPTDDFAEKPWRQINKSVKPVLRGEFEGVRSRFVHGDDSRAACAAM